MRNARRSGGHWAAACFAALLAGLVAGVATPLSENDKARWDTVWSLVEHGTYQIYPTADEARAANRPEQYGTIDKVMVEGRYYSSKPPLLPTVLAGLLIPVRHFGPAFSKIDRFDARVAPAAVYFKIALLLLYVPLAAAFLLMFARWLETAARTDFAYWFCLLAAGAGTLVTGYAGSLNNHAVAAWSAGIATLALWPAWAEGRRETWRFGVAGLVAGWTAANEVPAVLFVLVAFAAAWQACRTRALLAFLPAAALVAGAHFQVNKASFGTYAPAYARKEFYDYPTSYWTEANAAKRSRIDALSLPDATGAFVEGPRLELPFAVNGKPVGAFVSPVYLWHMVFGHHGWFSLTPIWLLALVGARHWRGPRAAPWAIFGISLVLVAFYWLANTERNYGGYCHGMRWLIWLTPLWLLLLPAALDRLAERPWGRIVAGACLAVSMFTAAGAMPNCWTYSWLHRLSICFGWVNY